MRRTFLVAGLIVLGFVVAGIAQQNPPRTQPPARPQQPVKPQPPAAQPAKPLQPVQPQQPVQPARPQQGNVPAAKPQGVEATDAGRARDEAEIIAVIEGVDKAFNAHDAQALAALFTAEAEIVDEDGAVTQGRAAIQQVFSGVFEESPQARLETEVLSLRFLGPTVAVEEGETNATYDPDEPPIHNRYVVIHVKEGGKWQMASARDYPVPETVGDEQLGQLGWLVGDWVDESEDSLIVTSYAWTEDRNYITSEFKVHIAGRPALNGTQRLGWDPLAKQIRSWVFDSDGGYAEGLWTRDGNRWIIKMRGVTKDGRVASGTNVITKLGPDRLTWQSRDRVVGGELIDDVDEVLVVRRPPPPAE